MENELYHEGRPGMRWGVRNGPPYPLREDQVAGSQYKTVSPSGKKASKSSGSSESSGHKKRVKKTSKADEPHKKSGMTDEELKAWAANDREREAKKAVRKEALDKAKTRASEWIAKQQEAHRDKQIRKGKISLSDMSDEELNKAIARAGLEETYLNSIGKWSPRQIMKASPPREKLLKTVMDDVGKNVVAPTVSGLATYTINKLLENAGNDKKTRKIMFSKMSNDDLKKAIERAGLEEKYLSALGTGTKTFTQADIDKILARVNKFKK